MAVTPLHRIDIMISKKLASQQANILDELSQTQAIGEYAFWSERDTKNFSENNLAKAKVLSTAVEVFMYLRPALENLRGWHKELGEKPKVGTDIESTGLEYYSKEVIGWGFAIPNSLHGYILVQRYLIDPTVKLPDYDLNEYFDYYFVHSHNGYYQEPTLEALAQIIKEYNPIIRWVLHNAKFDQHWFKSRLGVYLEDIDDSMVQAYLLGEKPMAIDMLAPKYLGRFPTTLSKLTGLEKTALRNAKPEVFLNIPIQELADYCCEDCIEGVLLEIIFSHKLKNQYTTYGEDEFVPHTLYDVYETCDRKSINALVWAEEVGINIEWDQLSEVRAELELELECIEIETAVKAGLTTEQSKEVCSSPKQLSTLLFDTLKLPTVGNKVGKGGFYSTAEEQLKAIQDFHPVPKLILQHRKYSKLQSTYIEGLWDRQRKGRIHTTFNNCQTVTGRYSSSDPNLQNIPNPFKSDLGKAIRKLFIASPGYTLVKADYSQFELRILAHLSQDPYLLESYHKGLDIHSAVTCLLFGYKYSDFKPDTDKEHKRNRTLVKNINFGLIYGMSPQKLFSMAKSAGMPYTLKDCEGIMQTYWSKLTGVTEWMAATKLKAVRDGYTETVLGRRRYFDFVHPYLKALRGTNLELSVDNWNALQTKGVLNEYKDQEAFRQCGNAPIQGSNADAIRICMWECFKEWYGSEVHLLLTVHDEIVLECPLDMHEQVSKRLKEIMEGAIKLDVPIVVDPTVALNWGDC